MIVECTVPVVVRCEVNGATVKVLSADFDKGWGGFFSEAEDAQGVWQESLLTERGYVEGCWGHPRQTFIAKVARNHIKDKGVPS